MLNTTTDNSTVLIEGNHIYWQEPIDGTHSSGISLRTKNVTVRKNVVHGFGGTASIQTYQDVYDGESGRPDGGYTNMLFENNLCYDGRNVEPMTFIDCGANFVVRNNTVVSFQGTQTGPYWFNGSISAKYCARCIERGCYSQ